MTNIDQFESVFKAADRTPFTPATVRIEKVLTITDKGAGESEQFAAQAKQFLGGLLQRDAPAFERIDGDQYSDVKQLLSIVDSHKPGLICLYRNLHAPAVEYPYSLGTYVDVLTQVSPYPVLVMPHPSEENCTSSESCHTVMAIASELAGDDHLVNYAVHFTAPGCRLWLSHVEDEHEFERYMGVIAKLPAIDTETARATIREQLLKEPADYIQSCREILEAGESPIKIETIVTLAHRLREYRRLVEEHDVNLLVMNTKQDDQLAMHGVAYPLSVELRSTPLLLL